MDASPLLDKTGLSEVGVTIDQIDHAVEVTSPSSSQVQLSNGKKARGCHNLLNTTLLFQATGCNAVFHDLRGPLV